MKGKVESDFTQPPLQTEFDDQAAKGVYIQSVMEVSHKALTKADTYLNQLIYEKAHANYICSLDGYMSLLKLTTDDPNFQTYLKK